AARWARRPAVAEVDLDGAALDAADPVADDRGDAIPAHLHRESRRLAVDQQRALVAAGFLTVVVDREDLQLVPSFADPLALQHRVQAGRPFAHGLVIDADRVAQGADRVLRGVPFDPHRRFALPAGRDFDQEGIGGRVDDRSGDLRLRAAALPPGDDRVAET